MAGHIGVMERNTFAAECLIHSTVHMEVGEMKCLLVDKYSAVGDIIGLELNLFERRIRFFRNGVFTNIEFDLPPEPLHLYVAASLSQGLAIAFKNELN
jgi:hypothetical protein